MQYKVLVANIYPYTYRLNAAREREEFEKAVDKLDSSSGMDSGVIWVAE
ncbi:MAG: hypothetical protein WA364_24245 [Candidatus Nitrosopolaris sp.]